MPVIHPAYDPETRTWFAVAQSKVTEAETIAELLVQLGPGYKAQDYYPAGAPFDFVHHHATAEKRVKRTMPPGVHRTATGELKAGPAPEAVVRTKRRHLTGKAEWVKTKEEEVALELWSLGLKGSEIGVRLGRPESWVGTVIARGRVRGDPRAIVRLKKTYGKKRTFVVRNGSGR